MEAMEPSVGSPLAMEAMETDETDVQENIPQHWKAFVHKSMAEFMQNRESVSENSLSSVARLYSGDQFIGTFTFVGEQLGVTDFHVVFSEKEEKILQDSLYVKVGNSRANVQHVVSFPHYDASFYKLLGAVTAPYFLKIENIVPCTGDDILLISFPALDESDYNSKLPMVSYGKIEQAVSDQKNSFLCAKYECYPGSSGGAVIDKKTSKLIGIHVGSIYYEDKTYNSPASLSTKQPDYPEECGAVRTLTWQPPPQDSDLEAISDESSNSQEGDATLNICVDTALDAFAESLKDVREIAYFAATNSLHKGHHACFLPSASLLAMVTREPFLAAHVNRSGDYKHNSERMGMRRKILDKKWRKQMRKLQRIIRGLKGTKVVAV